MKKIILVLCLMLVACQNTGAVEEVEIPEETIATIEMHETIETVVEEDSIFKERPDYEILFSSEIGGDRDLYLMDGDGSHVRCLLDLESKEGHADFSPDGKSIVFFSDMDGDRDLYMLDVEDPYNTLVQLTDAAGSDHLPDFSPDGKWITFESMRDGNSEIYLMDIYGENIKRLTQNSYKDKQPKFSPNGKEILYTVFISGVQKLAIYDLEKEKEKIIDQDYVGYVDFLDEDHIVFHGSNKGHVELFTMDLRNYERQTLLQDSQRSLWVPVYSPDGQWIVFNKEASYGTGNIFLYHVESGQEIQLTDTVNADWGPDFRPKTYSNICFDSNFDGDRDIYAYVNGEKINLTNNEVEDGIPYIYGNSLLFFSDRDGDDEIYMMNKDGSHLVQLTFNDKQDRAASFSHDGQYITFTSERDGDKEIFIMNRDGTNQKQLTHNSTKDFWSEFSYDDHYITYTTFESGQDTYRIDIRDWQNRDSFESELFMKNCSRCSFSPDGQWIAYSSKIKGYWQISIADLESLTERVLTSSLSNQWVPSWYDNDHLIFSRETGYKASVIKININTLEEVEILPKDAQNWRPIKH